MLCSHARLLFTVNVQKSKSLNDSVFNVLDKMEALQNDVRYVLMFLVIIVILVLMDNREDSL